MAERIPHNPWLEVLPDHAGPHYNDIHLLLLNDGLTLEQAVQSLDNSWMLVGPLKKAVFMMSMRPGLR